MSELNISIHRNIPRNQNGIEDNNILIPNPNENNIAHRDLPGGGIANNPILPPEQHPLNYMQHTTNGLQTLCSKYQIGGTRNFLPEQDPNNEIIALAVGTLALGDVQHLRNLVNCPNLNDIIVRNNNVDNQENENNIVNENNNIINENNIVNENNRFVVNENVNKILNQIIDGLSEGDNQEISQEKLQKAVRTLLLMLDTDKIKDSIDFEKHCLSIKNDGNDNLTEAATDKLLKQVADAVVQVMKSKDGVPFNETEMRIALEETEYNVSNAKDLLQITNYTMHQLSKTANANGLNKLKEACDKLLSGKYTLSSDDDKDAMMTKLAANKSQLKNITSILTKMVKNGNNAELASTQIKALNLLETQMLSTAKASINEKIRAAQADVIRPLFEQGKSKVTKMTLEVGPEFSVLGNLKIGGKLAFTYISAIKVNQPFGQISSTSSISAGLKAEVNYELPSSFTEGNAKGSVAFKGSRTKINVYANPEEMMESETASIFKKLMHYGKPEEVPNTGDNGLWAKTKRTFKRVGNFFKSVGIGIKDIFTGSHEKVAKKALMENSLFKSSMKQLGVFRNFDYLKQSSVNKKLRTQVVSYSFGGEANAEINLTKLSAFKGGSLKVEGKRTKTYKDSFDSLQNNIGDSISGMTSYLEGEYRNYENKLTDVLRREKEEFERIRNNPEELSSKDLLENIAKLKGEFDWFCQEVNNDDLNKRFFQFYSSRSADREQLMSSRSAGDRGEYLRALTTRCVALKLMLAKLPATDNVEAQEQKAICERLLNNLSAELEQPPVILSKKNQLWLTDVNHSKATVGEWTIELNAKFPPPPIPEKMLSGPIMNKILGGKSQDIEIKPKIEIKVPRDSNGFFKNRKTVNLSMGISGNHWLQYGPQLVSNVIQFVQQKFAAKAGDDQENSIIVMNAIKEMLSDFAGNIKNDLSSEKMNKTIQDELNKRTVKSKDGKVSLGKLLKYDQSSKSEFKISLNFEQSKHGFRYGGLTITNSSNKTISISGGAPVTSFAKISAKGSYSTSDTKTVLSSIGTDTLGPLCKAMSDLGSSPEGRKVYARNHKSALETICRKCRDFSSKITQELKDFATAIKAKSENLQRDLRNVGNRGVTGNTLIGKKIQDARKFVLSSFKFLKAFRRLSENQDNMPGPLLPHEITDLRTSARNLQMQINRTQNNRLTERELEQQTDTLIDNIQNEPLPEGYNNISAIMDMGLNMNLLDKML